MVKEQDRELEALRDEIAKQRQCALDSLNLDEQTQIVVDELKANNERVQEQSANLKQQVDALQGRIGSMRSEFVQFQAMVSNRLSSDIRPSVVALQDEYAGLKRGYQEVASKYRQVICNLSQCLTIYIVGYVALSLFATLCHDATPHVVSKLVS